MLNSYGVGKRKARFEANLVCCWASMCNIRYDYSQDDSFGQALQKVVGAIRQKGIRLYNFVVNTDAAEVDLCFHEYALPDDRAMQYTFVTCAPSATNENAEEGAIVAWAICP
jgi:hypothetical protein